MLSASGMAGFGQWMSNGKPAAIARTGIIFQRKIQAQLLVELVKLIRVAELEELHDIHFHKIEVLFDGLPPLEKLGKVHGLEQLVRQGQLLAIIA